jgi:hypothetical protein
MNNVIHFPGSKPTVEQPEVIEPPEAGEPQAEIPRADGVDLEFVQNSCLILSAVLDELADVCAREERERVNEILGAVKRQVRSWPDLV